jgi:hypothetical protein
MSETTASFRSFLMFPRLFTDLLIKCISNFISLQRFFLHIIIVTVLFICLYLVIVEVEAGTETHKQQVAVIKGCL